jgi:acylphosphatase
MYSSKIRLKIMFEKDERVKDLESVSKLLEWKTKDNRTISISNLELIKKEDKFHTYLAYANGDESDIRSLGYLIGTTLSINNNVVGFIYAINDAEVEVEFTADDENWEDEIYHPTRLFSVRVGESKLSISDFKRINENDKRYSAIAHAISEDIDYTTFGDSLIPFQYDKNPSGQLKVINILR